MERYSEENSFPLYYFVLIGLIYSVASFISVRMLSEEQSSNILYLLVGWFVLSALFLLNVSKIRTVVTSEKICVRFGRIFPIFWMNVPLANIQTVGVVDISWWRRWNLGMHPVRLRTPAIAAIFYGGPRAVNIELPGMRVLVGSDRPEALLAAIEREREKTTR